MTKQLTPEVLDITQVYIQCGFSLEKTAEHLGLDMQEVSTVVSQPQAKQYINEVYLDTGYRNRAKLGSLLDRIIDEKIKEAEDTEMWSDMDLADLVKLAHKIRTDEAKLGEPNTQVNIANFGDSKYSELVNRLLNGKNS